MSSCTARELTWGTCLVVCTLWLGLSVIVHPLLQDSQVAHLRHHFNASRTSPHHAIVLVHGLHGVPMTLWNTGAVIQQQLQAQRANGGFVYYANANWGYLMSFFSTSDGIRAGGAHLADEVDMLLREFPTVNAVSFVGLSLGGLYSRYALGELHERHPDLHLANLVTLATPHAGVRGHLGWFHDAAASLGGAGVSGLELQQLDEAQTLLELSSGRYLRALRKVENKVLYGSVEGDLMVPLWSAALVPDNSHLHTWCNHGILRNETNMHTGHVYVRSVFWQDAAPTCVARSCVEDCDDTHTQACTADEAESSQGEVDSLHAVLQPLFKSSNVEDIIVARLRRHGGAWKNVHLDFRGGWFHNMNHERIAGMWLIEDRDEVARHVAQELVGVNP